MKKLFLFTSIITLFCNALYSQWAPIGAKWYYDHYSGAQPYLTIIESIKDTVILSKQCKVLQSYEIYAVMDSTGGYHWDTLYCPLQFTYYDSSKVYLYDNVSDAFYVLYNFNALAGDTITVRDSLFPGYCPDTYQSNLFQYKIDSVRDTIISGINLRKQYVKTTQNSEWYITDPYVPSGYNPTIIERIGSYKYLFGVMSFVEGSISHLRCYQDSSIYYRSPDWPITLSCDYLYTLPTNIIEVRNPLDIVEVFPNPLTQNAQIILPEHLSLNNLTVDIFDLQGRKVKGFQEISSHHLTLYRADFNAGGMYFVRIKSAQYLETIKLVVQ